MIVLLWVASVVVLTWVYSASTSGALALVAGLVVFAVVSVATFRAAQKRDP